MVRPIHHILLGAGVCSLLLTGCPTAADDDDSAPDDDDALASVTVQLRLVSVAVVGAEVCIVEGAPEVCVTTEESGDARFDGLPPGAELAFTIIDDVVPPTLVAATAGEAGTVNVIGFSFTTQSLLATYYDRMGDAYGFTYDGALGGILINLRPDNLTWTTNVAGVTATIDPDLGEGPAYGDFDEVRTASTDLGEIAFANMPDGTYSVTLAHETLTCRLHYGWAADDGATVRFPVLSGMMTQATVVCE